MHSFHLQVDRNYSSYLVWDNVTRDIVHTASACMSAICLLHFPCHSSRVIYTPFSLIPTSVVLLLPSHAWHLKCSAYFVSSVAHLITNCVRSKVSSSPSSTPFYTLFQQCTYSSVFTTSLLPFLYFSQALYWKMFTDYIWPLSVGSCFVYCLFHVFCTL
jgi:hypothetical protein